MFHPTIATLAWCPISFLARLDFPYHIFVPPIPVRPASPSDLHVLASMCHLLWPDATADEHARELAPILAGHAPGSLPQNFFLAQHADGRAIGFIQVGLRSHADGCDP